MGLLKTRRIVRDSNIPIQATNIVDPSSVENLRSKLQVWIEEARATGSNALVLYQKEDDPSAYGFFEIKNHILNLKSSKESAQSIYIKLAAKTATWKDDPAKRDERLRSFLSSKNLEPFLTLPDWGSISGGNTR